MDTHLNGKHRDTIRVGLVVDIIRKEDQGSGKKTRGIVQDILTNSLSHPHGIKVRLKGGHVGRVTEIFSSTASKDTDGKNPTERSDTS
ncbi:MAG: YwbE family protein [Methanoregula sp.]|jgi:uncharacterized repeat protein (TIGR03833 family)|nr:YwbE family protein [Methanoregula sp.]